ncbi:MAG: serine protease [Oligoflexia bacterium]|jgi:secreted trypsin-like serine protease
MKHALNVVIAAAVLVFGGTAQATQKKLQPISGTIVGGEDAAPGELPFIVSIQRRSGSHFCGGSLIGKRWVLTAAHCVDAGDESRIRVVAGLHERRNPQGVQAIDIARVIQHPEYQSATITSDYDFALLELKDDAVFDSIALNDVEIEIPSDEEKAQASVTAGWGTTSEGGMLSNILQKVTVPLVSKERCEVAYPGKMSDRMICAGLEAGMKDSCQGDSGGPLLVHDDHDRPLLVGVVSWGAGCARPKKYGVYSKVNSVIEWIRSQVGTSLL